ncbi:MAG: hypothetical protein ABJA37_07550 [Ferruginibacter sp.]
MKASKIFAALSIMLITAGAVNAQTVKNEHHRIRQGVRSGELTRHETKTLVHQQKDIHQDKKEAKADGVVTGAEKREIKQDKRQASRSIYRKKHNNRDRN